MIERLLYLDAEKRGKEITLIINSPGGMNAAGFAIYDVMQSIESPVSTLCFGLDASSGALLLSGERGRRFAAPHARIMLHQPWVQGRIEGPATDRRIHANEIMKQRKLIEQIIADHSGSLQSRSEPGRERDGSRSLVYGRRGRGLRSHRRRKGGASVTRSNALTRLRITIASCPASF